MIIQSKYSKAFVSHDITPMSFDTIGGHAIKTLVEFIQKNSFKGTAVEFKTFKVEV